MLTTPWISRLVALSLLLAVMAAAYVFVIDPLVVAYAETDDAIADTRVYLQHVERLGATRPALAKQMAQLDRRHRSQGYYLSGGTDALAAAALQDRLKQVIDANGGTLRSIQPLPGMDEQGFRRVTVRVQMTATTESLFRTVYMLEAGTPLVFIENIGIQNRMVRRTKIQTDDSELTQEPILTVGFDLYGYLPLEAK
jgi:general secretion pathway protein M